MRIELGIPLSLSQIAKYSGGVMNACYDPRITHICTDSREVSIGDLFIALKGDKYDGADYVDVAKKKGGYIISPLPDQSDIYHQNTKAALLNLASNYAKNLPYLLYKIGITGSVGKTTTKEFAKIILSEVYKTQATIGNFNNEIGMPLSILSAKENTQILLMEMGMNAPGEMKRLSECLGPDIALITNIGTAHIGNFGSKESIAKAKLEILDGMNGGTLIVPKDELLLSDVKEKLTFSIANPKADIYLKNINNGHIEIYMKKKKTADVQFDFLEKHHLECLASAVAISVVAGVSFDKIRSAMPKISRDNIRQKLVSCQNFNLHCDYYNASRESMIASIIEFQKLNVDNKKSLVLGDILELGGLSNEIHYEIGKSIDHRKINNIFLFGEAARIIGIGTLENGFPIDRIFINTDLAMPDITAGQIISHCSPGEHILFKASRAIRLERVIEHIKKEGGTDNG